MNFISEEKLELFLEDLSKLSNKYGIEIGGCGCCGSPYLSDTEYNGKYDCNRFDGDYDGLSFQEKK